MGHTRFKKKKKRWTTRKAKRAWSTQSKGGATITKTKRVQQSFDTIHDFYSLERGLFKIGLDSNVSTLQRAYAAMVAANPQDPQIAQAQVEIQHAKNRAKLYETMKKVMQYMIITLNSVTFNIPILPTIHTRQSINGDTQFAKYTGNKKEGQLFYAGQGVPSSKVTTSGIEIQGREYFEIPPGREWPKLLDPAASFRNLTSLLFNLNDNPDIDTITEYYAALQQSVPAPEVWQSTRREFTAAHQIYMVCDAGANTYGKLRDFAEEAGIDIAELIELVVPATTGDSASSNPYHKHKFTFIASPAREGRPYNPNVFISDANLYTSDIYEVRYELDQWNEATGLGFKLVVSLRDEPTTVLFELVYGILGEGQTPFVRPAGSRAQPAIYNSQGPSAASLSGCALLRALNTASVAPGLAAPAGVFPDIDNEKIGKQPPVNPLSPARVRDMVATAPIPELPGGNTLRDQVVAELTQIMTQQNGVSPLCGTPTMVDPYNRLGDRFGTLPPELWLDIKRGGDRDQVMSAYYLSQEINEESGNLKYPFIHFVTGDELAAKMAVELGLAVIYQANGNIRYWPKMFRFRPESRIPALSLYRITTDPFPDAATGDWQISLWGGKQMKGGLRNPISAVIGMPSYTHIEDKDGVQYTFDAQGNFYAQGHFANPQDQFRVLGINGILHIVIYDTWLNPSKYVMMKQIKPLVVSPIQIMSEIRENYLIIKAQIPQIPELPDRQLTEVEIGTILTEIANRLSIIDYRSLDPSIQQAIINVLQRITILKTDNRGIYQYDFINQVIFGDNPQINELDELTFRSVNNSKEDDGLEGAALIGENSPAVQVTPDHGGAPWIIPALLDATLLEYDITFMATRFTQTLIQYCRRQNLTIQEVRQEFITQYGIVPIVSYIQAKYAGAAPANLKERIEIAIMTSAQQNASSVASSAASSAASSRAATPVPSSSSSAATSTQTPLQPPPLLRQLSDVSPLFPVGTASAATPSAVTPSTVSSSQYRFSSTPSTPSSPSSQSSQDAYTPSLIQESSQERVESVGAITPSVFQRLNLSAPPSAVNPAGFVSRVRKYKRKYKHASSSSRPHVTLTPAVSLGKRKSNVNAKKYTNSQNDTYSGGKRHTKKKHRRKKRETQKKRSKSTSQ